jgi:hypothetical protein
MCYYQRCNYLTTWHAFHQGGCIVLVVFGPRSDPTITAETAISLYQEVPYIVYLSCVAVVSPTCWALYHFAGRIDDAIGPSKGTLNGGLVTPPPLSPPTRARGHAACGAVPVDAMHPALRRTCDARRLPCTVHTHAAISVYLMGRRCFGENATGGPLPAHPCTDGKKTEVFSAMRPFTYALYAALIGTQSVLYAKITSSLIQATMLGDNQFTSWYTYVAMLILAITAVCRLHTAGCGPVPSCSPRCTLMHE